MIPEHLQPYLVIIVIVVSFVLIIREQLRPAISFLIANLIFIVFGVLTAGEVLLGFSNESIISIILLILLAAGLQKNFNLETLLDQFYRKRHTYQSFLLVMMAKVAVISSFLNNTPVVAAMTPYVVNWGKKRNIAPSKLLIPLSFATIWGGMITLIGTSTTLVLNGFLSEKGLEFNLIHLLIVGVSVCITGILFMTIFGHRLLPDHSDVVDDFNKNPREYLVETQLMKNSSLIDKTVHAAGLRQLKGIYLVEIIRGQSTISPVEPTEVIQDNDTLIFAGDTTQIMELIQSNPEIQLPKHADALSQETVALTEVVIGPNSGLIGKKVRFSDFRNLYDAAIVAVHRNGEKLSGKIGDIRMRTGDLLLLLAGDQLKNRIDLYRDLYVISKKKKVTPPGKTKIYSLAIVALLSIVLLLLGYFPLIVSLMLIFTLMAGLKMITMQDIKREVDINLVAILVFSLALGNAVIKTGAGDMIATLMIDFFSPFGVEGILIALLVITTMLTSFISNVGAVSITFPLAYALSNSLGLPGAPFYLAIAYAASAAFLTPIGYQTNLIIYGPGGYKFRDFMKIGFPVTLVYLGTVFMVIRLLYPSAFD
ncbi:MAG: SLC13 family permease [Cyclobacteriaceae bacterium]